MRAEVTALQRDGSRDSPPTATGLSPPPEAETAAKAAVAKYLPVLEAHLGKHSFVAGTAFTVADINVACALSYAAIAKYDLSPYTATTAWMAKVMARPAFTKAKGTSTTAGK